MRIIRRVGLAQISRQFTIGTRLFSINNFLRRSNFIIDIKVSNVRHLGAHETHNLRGKATYRRRFDSFQKTFYARITRVIFYARNSASRALKDIDSFRYTNGTRQEFGHHRRTNTTKFAAANFFSARSLFFSVRGVLDNVNFQRARGIHAATGSNFRIISAPFKVRHISARGNFGVTVRQVLRHIMGRTTNNIFFARYCKIFRIGRRNVDQMSRKITSRHNVNAERGRRTTTNTDFALLRQDKGR